MVQVSRVHVYLTYPFVLSWSLLESMSAQSAILASNTPPLHEAIKEGETGMLVDFFDHAALVDKLDAILEDPELRERLGRNARDFVIRTYDLEKACLLGHLDFVDRLADMPLVTPSF